MRESQVIRRGVAARTAHETNIIYLGERHRALWLQASKRVSVYMMHLDPSRESRTCRFAIAIALAIPLSWIRMSKYLRCVLLLSKTNSISIPENREIRGTATSGLHILWACSLWCHFQSYQILVKLLKISIFSLLSNFSNLADRMFMRYGSCSLWCQNLVRFFLASKWTGPISHEHSIGGPAP